MKRAAILSILLYMIFLPFAYAAEVKNVTAKQVGNRMLFEYDLMGDEPEADVNVTITVKGRAYATDKLHLEGDFGKVRTGRVKKIWWNVLQDFPQGVAEDVEWEVVAGARAFKDPVTGMEFIFVRGGCFEMGDTFGDRFVFEDELPAHEVCVSDFYLGKYEATQGQWKKVMGSNPSFKENDDHPVESVSWHAVQEFIGRFNQMARKSYRLPTEAEWEYAARSGGKKEKFAGTSQESELGDYAWYRSNSGGSTHPVGQKKPNGLGFYDMSGNVWEWVADWYDQGYYRNSPKNKPQGPSSGSYKVLRGGSWYSNPGILRAASRNKNGLSERFATNYHGFRLVAPSR